MSSGPDYALADAELLARCRLERFRSSGPGGQHANRTESAVRLVHLACGLTVQRQDHREQDRNRRAALRDLRLALVCRERGRSDPAWLAPYRKAGRCILGPAAQDYHLVAACCLDALATAQGRLAGAAETLDLSTSQLARLLRAEPRVQACANALRMAAGLGPVR